MGTGGQWRYQDWKGRRRKGTRQKGGLHRVMQYNARANAREGKKVGAGRWDQKGSGDGRDLASPER